MIFLSAKGGQSPLFQVAATGIGLDDRNDRIRRAGRFGRRRATSAVSMLTLAAKDCFRHTKPVHMESPGGPKILAKSAFQGQANPVLSWAPFRPRAGHVRTVHRTATFDYRPPHTQRLPPPAPPEVP